MSVSLRLTRVAPEAVGIPSGDVHALLDALEASGSELHGMMVLRHGMVAAVELLTGHGVLEPRTDDQLVEGWERSGEGIGAGYVLHRDALMLLIDTGDVDLALARRSGCWKGCLPWIPA